MRRVTVTLRSDASARDCPDPWLDIRIAVTFVHTGVKVIGSGISPDQCPAYHVATASRLCGLEIDTERGPRYAGNILCSADGLHALVETSAIRNLSVRFTAAQACQIALRLLDGTIATLYSEKVKAVRIFSHRKVQ